MKVLLFTKFFIILFVFSICGANTQSHINIGISFIGLTYHIKKPKTPKIFTHKLNPSGRFVLTRGIVVFIEKPFYKNQLALRFEQSILSDCASKISGYTFLSLRAIADFYQYRANVGVGPGIYYRKSWKNIDYYQNEGLFKEKRNTQYRFIWHAGNLSLSYPMNKNYRLNTTLIPAIPELVVFTTGVETNF